jgi:WD40 repeat protein/mono/diheme cytochrome c family protein
MPSTPKDTRCMFRSPPLVAFALLLSCALTGADESDSPPSSPMEKVSYWNEVRPIFQVHCQGCHQPAKSSGEYVMTSFDSLLAGGESGEQAIAPSDPESSYLVAQITPVDGLAAMPQDQSALSLEQVDLIVRWIAQGALDDTPQSARRRYDAEHPPEYDAAPVVTSIQFAPSGNLLAVSGYHEVVLHDLAKVIGRQPSLVGRLIGMSERIESVAFSPDGARLAVAGGSPGRLGELQIWDLASRELTVALPASYDTCYGASWSADGQLVAIGCPDNTVRAYEAETGKQVLFSGAHNDWVLDTVFSMDASHLVTVSRDRSMKLIEVATERFVDNITSITPGALKGGLHAVDRHPSKDELLIGGSDGIAKTYRMFREKDRKIGDDFNLIRAYGEMPGRIFDVAYRADGERLVAGSSYNGTGHVQVFETDSGQLVTTLEDIPSAVYAVAFSPDGQRIASGGFAGTVSLHDAQTGTVQAEFVPVPLRHDPLAKISE